MLMQQMASHGFVVIASLSTITSQGNPVPTLVGLDWLLQQAEDPTSVYYHRLDTAHIGAFGHSEGGASTCIAASDPRITAIGGVLRKYSLDELPQIWNVLTGQMSLVGPRPLLRRELDDYGAVISLYERVRPGITGLWQISGRSHTTFAERVSYDEWYIKNWTVWYDMVIVLQTFWVLMTGAGAY